MLLFFWRINFSLQWTSLSVISILSFNFHTIDWFPILLLIPLVVKILDGLSISVILSINFIFFIFLSCIQFSFIDEEMLLPNGISWFRTWIGILKYSKVFSTWDILILKRLPVCEHHLNLYLLKWSTTTHP